MWDLRLEVGVFERQDDEVGSAGEEILERAYSDGGADEGWSEDVALASEVLRDEDAEGKARDLILVEKDGAEELRRAAVCWRSCGEENEVRNFAAGVGLGEKVVDVIRGSRLGGADGEFDEARLHGEDGAVAGENEGVSAGDLDGRGDGDGVGGDRQGRSEVRLRLAMLGSTMVLLGGGVAMTVS